MKTISIKKAGRHESVSLRRAKALQRGGGCLRNFLIKNPAL